MISMLDILKLAYEKKASDIHITAGCPPALRINGSIYKIETEPLTAEMSKKMCYSVLSDEQKANFEEKKFIDFSFFVKNLTRFRGALFFQKSAVTGTFRLLSIVPPDISNLGLPPSLENLINYPNGLVLVTGPTGSGKSTTLAAVINVINETRRGHILTLEDPVELVHSHKNCIINQREIGADCRSFAEGMKSALRADPDICLVGEMRDPETIKLSLKLAETGHLVFSTLHTNSAAKTVDRIISSFPIGDRDMVSNQLSTVIQAVVSQKLIKTKNGERRIAVEIMFANAAIRNLIREGKVFQIYSVLQTKRAEGMTTMNQSLLDLVKSGEVDPKEAFKASPNQEELFQMLKKRKISA